MDDGVGALCSQQRLEALVLLGEVEVHEADLLAGQCLPDPDAFAHRTDRGERVDLELEVYLTAAQVVDDDDVMARIREVQRGGPTTESVSTEY